MKPDFKNINISLSLFIFLYYMHSRYHMKSLFLIFFDIGCLTDIELVDLGIVKYDFNSYFRFRNRNVIAFVLLAINANHIKDIIRYVVHLAYEGMYINENINGTLWKFINIAGEKARERFDIGSNTRETYGLEQAKKDAKKTQGNLDDLIKVIKSSYQSEKLFCTRVDDENGNNVGSNDKRLPIDNIFQYYENQSYDILLELRISKLSVKK